jgi:hypothetical protein
VVGWYGVCSLHCPLTFILGNATIRDMRRWMECVMERSRGGVVSAKARGRDVR